MKRFLLVAVILDLFWFQGLASPPRYVRISYPQADASTTIGIAWNSDSINDPSLVEYGKDKNYGQTAQGVVFVGPGVLKAIHEVTITGLEPNTLYHYRVGGDGAWSDDYTFRTAPDDPCTPITFVVLGDDRSDDSSGASPRWGPILMEAVEQNPLFVLNTGDLVMDGKKDKQWRDFFEKSETALAFVPHMPTIGNHDDGPEQGDKAYYNQVFHLPKNSVTGTEDFYYFTVGNVIVVSLSTQTFKGNNFSEQAEYLDKVLTENPRLWKFVFFHHPVYSSHLSFLGFDISHPPNENGQNAELTKVFDKHHVDIVFYGHNHWYERLGPMKGKGGSDEGEPVSSPEEGTFYVVTGGAGALTYGILDVIKLFCPNTKGSKVCDGSYHYVKIEIYNNHLTFTAHATKAQLFSTSPNNSKVLDTFTIEKAFIDGIDPCKVTTEGDQSEKSQEIVADLEQDLGSEEVVNILYENDKVDESIIIDEVKKEGVIEEDGQMVIDDFPTSLDISEVGAKQSREVKGGGCAGCSGQETRGIEWLGIYVLSILGFWFRRLY